RKEHGRLGRRSGRGLEALDVDARARNEEGAGLSRPARRERGLEVGAVLEDRVSARADQDRAGNADHERAEKASGAFEKKFSQARDRVDGDRSALARELDRDRAVQDGLQREVMNEVRLNLLVNPREVGERERLEKGVRTVLPEPPGNQLEALPPEPLEVGVILLTGGHENDSPASRLQRASERHPKVVKIP